MHVSADELSVCGLCHQKTVVPVIALHSRPIAPPERMSKSQPMMIRKRLLQKFHRSVFSSCYSSLTPVSVWVVWRESEGRPSILAILDLYHSPCAVDMWTIVSIG